MTDVIVVPTTQIQVVENIQSEVQIVAVPSQSIQIIAQGVQGPPGPSVLTIYASGNTTGQSSSGTFAGNSLPIQAAGNVSVGISAGNLIISGSGGAGTGGVALSAGTQSASSGTVNFANSNGISFGMSGSNQITASYTVPAQTVQTLGIYASGNTTGQSSSSTIDARSFSIDGANGVSVGLSNGSFVVSGPQTAPQTNQTLGAYAVGNTTLSSSGTFDARSMSIEGAGNVSVGISNGSVQISAPTQTNQSLGVYALSNTTLSTSGTLDARSLSFEGAGAVSVGVSNGSVQISAPNTIAQTNQTLGLYGVGNTTQNSSTTLDARTLSFDGLGGISIGYSNGSIQVSGPQTVAQTNQTDGWYAVGNTTQNSSTTLDARTQSIGGRGNITVGFSNGTIQISGSQSADTLGFYAVGNTTQNSSTTLDGRTLSYNFLGAATGGFSNGSIDISVPVQSAQTQSVIQAIYDGANSISSGTVRFTNANGVSFSVNGQTISASVAAQTNQTLGLYAISNTTGASSSSTIDARSFSIEGAGVASVGLTNGTFIVSVPSGGGGGLSAGVSNIGNTAGNTGTVSNQLILAGGNNITLSESTAVGGATVTISAPNQTNQTVGLYALGNTTQNSSTTVDARSLSFDGLGIVTVGYSNGSIQLSATTAAQTNQSEGWYAVGNTTQNSSTTLDARTHTLNGLGIITVGYSNGSIQLSATTAAQTNQTVGLYAVGNTTQNSSTTLDARTLSFDFLGAATGGFSNGSIQVSVPTQTAQTQSNIQALYDGVNSIFTGTVRVSNANGVSFGINGQTLTASVAAQTNQTLGLYAISNTTGASSSSTIDARSFSIEGAGIASVGLTNGTFVVSVPSGGGNVFSAGASNVGNTSGNTGTVSNQLVFAGGNNITVSQGTAAGGATLTISAANQTNQTENWYAVGNTTQNSSTNFDARTHSLNGAGIITVGYSNGSIQISATTNQTNQTLGLYALGNTTAQSSSTTVDARSLSFDGANGVSIGMSGGSIVISGATGGGGGGNFSAGVSTGGNTQGNTGTVSNQIIFVGSGNVSLSQNTGAGGATVTINDGGGATLSNFYWPPVQVQSQTLGANLQNSASFQYVPLPNYLTMSRLAALFSFSAQSSTSSTGTFGASLYMGLYTLTGSTLSSISVGTQSYSITWSSNGTGTVNGLRQLSVPMNTLLTPGEYWVACNISTSNAGAGLSIGVNGVAFSLLTTPIAQFGNATNLSNAYPYLIGFGAQGGVGTLTRSYNTASITRDNRGNMLLQMGNYTLW